MKVTHVLPSNNPNVPDKIITLNVPTENIPEVNPHKGDEWDKHVDGVNLDYERLKDLPNNTFNPNSIVLNTDFFNEYDEKDMTKEQQKKYLNYLDHMKKASKAAITMIESHIHTAGKTQIEKEELQLIARSLGKDKDAFRSLRDMEDTLYNLNLEKNRLKEWLLKNGETETYSHTSITPNEAAYDKIELKKYRELGLHIANIIMNSDYRKKVEKATSSLQYLKNNFIRNDYMGDGLVKLYLKEEKDFLIENKKRELEVGFNNAYKNSGKYYGDVYYPMVREPLLRYANGIIRKNDDKAEEALLYYRKEIIEISKSMRQMKRDKVLDDVKVSTGVREFVQKKEYKEASEKYEFLKREIESFSKLLYKGTPEYRNKEFKEYALSNMHLNELDLKGIPFTVNKRKLNLFIEQIKLSAFNTEDALHGADGKNIFKDLVMKELNSKMMDNPDDLDLLMEIVKSDFEAKDDEILISVQKETLDTMSFRWVDSKPELIFRAPDMIYGIDWFCGNEENFKNMIDKQLNPPPIQIYNEDKKIIEKPKTEGNEVKIFGDDNRSQIIYKNPDVFNNWFNISEKEGIVFKHYLNMKTDTKEFVELFEKYKKYAIKNYELIIQSKRSLLVNTMAQIFLTINKWGTHQSLFINYNDNFEEKIFRNIPIGSTKAWETSDKTFTLNDKMYSIMKTKEESSINKRNLWLMVVDDYFKNLKDYHYLDKNGWYPEDIYYNVVAIDILAHLTNDKSIGINHNEDIYRALNGKEGYQYPSIICSKSLEIFTKNELSLIKDIYEDNITYLQDLRKALLRLDSNKALTNTYNNKVLTNNHDKNEDEFRYIGEIE